MTSRLPSLNWLRVFEAAARCESFARAAVQLNLSAAAISQQVKALEGHLGTPLFTRHAHAVKLTEAGRAYLPSVQQSLLTLENATEGLFGPSRSHQLFVQSVLLFAHGVLAPALPDFKIDYPDINLTLSTGNSVLDYSRGFNDLQIVFGNPQSFGASSDRVMGEELYPVALPEIAKQIRNPQDLVLFDLIEVATHRAGWPFVFDALRISTGRARFMFSDNTIMATALAAQGLGIALARAPASDISVRAAGLVDCLPGLRVSGSEAYHLVYPDLTSLRKPARQFREWLLQRAANESR
ncbi:MAG: LysR family transcriptional regulator [Paracoccaceae bacterium]